MNIYTLTLLNYCSNKLKLKHDFNLEYYHGNLFYYVYSESKKERYCDYHHRLDGPATIPQNAPAEFGLCGLSYEYKKWIEKIHSEGLVV